MPPKAAKTGHALTPQQEKFLAALLEQGTLTAACRVSAARTILEQALVQTAAEAELAEVRQAVAELRAQVADLQESLA